MAAAYYLYSATVAVAGAALLHLSQLTQNCYIAICRSARCFSALIIDYSTNSGEWFRPVAGAAALEFLFKRWRVSGGCVRISSLHQCQRTQLQTLHHHRYYEAYCRQGTDSD